MTPRTIITYLTNWNPAWIKTVEFSNRLIKWISIPRKEFKEALQRNEMNFSWVYFLLWEDENWNNLAYIWQATVLKNRLNNHYNDTDKDFWNNAICFTYKDWSLTESDINFLEKKLIEESKRINRYTIKNNTWWNNWLIQEHRIPDMKEFIDDLKILIANLGYWVLKEIVTTKELKNKKNIYYLTTCTSDAKWVFTEEWFLVLKWSRITQGLSNSEKKSKWYAYRNRSVFENKGIVNNLEFTQDYTFPSPSSAASFIAWSSMNWWIAWKDENWNTLDENERQK